MMGPENTGLNLDSSLIISLEKRTCLIGITGVPRWLDLHLYQLGQSLRIHH